MKIRRKSRVVQSGWCVIIVRY